MPINFPPTDGQVGDGSFTFTDPETGVTYRFYRADPTRTSGRGYWSAAGSGEPGATGATGPSQGASGATGASGPEGASGATGERGATGPDGATGPAGGPGVDGATGASGASGPQGLQGPRGPMGPQGPQGTPGSAGIIGSTGATGLGSSGATGASGPEGPEGATGIQGQDGPPGPPGGPGPSGATGIQGLRGATGPLGSTGATGPQGSPGGATGPSGPPGTTGATGSPGGPGGDGPPGPPGSPGGATGPIGATGATGVVQASSPTFSVQYNVGLNTLGGNPLLTYDGNTLSAVNEIQGDISGYSRTLNPGRNINGVLFDGSQNITIVANTVGVLTMTTAGLGLTGTTVFNGNDAIFTVRSDADSLNTPNSIVYRDGTGSFSAEDITAGGDVTIRGDLTVEGTTTTIDTETLQVEDRNITLGNVTTPTDATANGGGLTLRGSTDKTLEWLQSTGRWTVNQDFQAANFYGALVGNADSATVLETARNINGVPFDGSQNITINAATVGVLTMTTSGLGLSGSAVFNGSDVIFDVNSNATSAADLNTLVFRDGTGRFSATEITSNLVGNVNGTATNATNAVNATNINPLPDASVTDAFVLFSATQSGNQRVRAAGSLRYDAATGNLSSTTFTGTLSGTATRVSQNLTAGTDITSTGAYNGSTARTFSVQSATGNTANRIVKRDGSGNFSAGTITAALNGNATTATTATTANALNTSNSYRMRSLGVNAAPPSIGEILAAGDITAFSDERLKTNWRPLAPDFVSKLAKVKSGVYDRTDMPATQAGVSAQELQKVLPESVTQVGADGTLAVAYGHAALASSVELAKEVVMLREELEEYKELVKQLLKGE